MMWNRKPVAPTGCPPTLLVVRNLNVEQVATTPLIWLCTSGTCG